MNKDEILAKSRQEHKDRDLYEIQLVTKASNIGVLVASGLATVFFIVQYIAGKGFGLGLYAILLSVGAAQFLYKAAKLKRRREILLAVVYSAAALVLSAAHIISLFR